MKAEINHHHFKLCAVNYGYRSISSTLSIVGSQSVSTPQETGDMLLQGKCKIAPSLFLSRFFSFLSFFSCHFNISVSHCKNSDLIHVKICEVLFFFHFLFLFVFFLANTENLSDTKPRSSVNSHRKTCKTRLKLLSQFESSPFLCP